MKHFLTLTSEGFIYMRAFIMTNNSVISNNDLPSNGIGIILIRSKYNDITNNTATNNYSSFGIAYDSNGNYFADNAALYSRSYGISVQRSSDNILENNLVIGGSFGGLIVEEYSNNNIVTGNVVDSASNGIGVFFFSNNNTITNNTSANNSYGIRLTYATNTLIYNNNFINNALQAHGQFVSRSVLNLDAPIGGNYWSNFDTPAEGCGDANLDGFCDSPFSTNIGSDRLPWTVPNGWAEPTVEDVKDEIADLLDTGGITSEGIANSLTSTLNNVLAALDAGDTNAALNMLGAFINKVEAQAGKKISEDAAAELLEAISSIIEDL